MSKYIKFSAAAALAFAIGSSHAAPPPAPIPTEVSQNRGYIGLTWTMENASAVPDVVVGLRHTKTAADADVTGYDVSVRFKLFGNTSFDSVRAVYLNGNRSSQANVGLGYSMKHQSVFGTVGGSGEHLKLGLDYLYKPAKFDPFIEINTLEKPEEAKATPTPLPV
jgi:hypothetical protein